jgi:malate dehydrogenase (oxaloacetate-decarboxylating)
VKRFRRAAPAEVATHDPPRPPNDEETEALLVENEAAEVADQHFAPAPAEPNGAFDAVVSYAFVESAAAQAEEPGAGVEPGGTSEVAVGGQIVLEAIDLSGGTDAALEAVDLTTAAEAALEAVELSATAGLEPAGTSEAADAGHIVLEPIELSDPIGIADADHIVLEPIELSEAADAALEAVDTIGIAGLEPAGTSEAADAGHIVLEPIELSDPDDAGHMIIEAIELNEAADAALGVLELGDTAADAAYEPPELPAPPEPPAAPEPKLQPEPHMQIEPPAPPTPQLQPEPAPAGTPPIGPEPAPAGTPPIGRVRTRWIAADGAWETTQRGRQIINDPRLYRGVAFNDEERRSLGLVGLLPPQVISLHEQLIRAAGQYAAQPTNLAKNVYLALLQDRNEVLFYRLLSDHLAEMLPIVYTPTVGEAIQHFSQEYRRPRGVFLSIDHPDDVELSLMGTGLGAEDVDLIVVTDGEAILGIGDWGVGGISISLGKLAVYTAAGGIDPGRAIAVVLDVGTNRQSLLDDPLYLGNRHPRADHATYDAFVDTFVETATGLFPNALLHWEDLRARNSRRILRRWREEAFTFNDDMQGTGAVALAAIRSGLKRTKLRMADQRIVIYGAGTAGIGIAEQLRQAMIADGLDPAQATAHFWCIDRQGLLVQSLDVVMEDFQRPFAHPDAEVEDWNRDDDGQIGLTEVIRHVEATILIGTSGQPGAFTESTIRTMALSCQNPIILPLSNPTELAEAVPGDVLQWTGGRALVATGSAFDPVTYAWTTHYIGQANNAFAFPGIGLGATLVGATRVTDGMLLAAAEAISSQVDASIEGAPLLPEVDALHATSVAVAAAVGRAAIAEGVARWALPEPAEEAAEAAMWRPEYRVIRAV